MQNLVETYSVTPLDGERTVTPVEIRGRTSGYAGKMIPVTMFDLKREDRINRMDLRVKVDMDETQEMLLNGVSVQARAVFVPHLAMERFEGSLDRFNRSFKGEPDKEGGDVVPFFTTHAFDKDAEIYRALGTHWPQGDPINTGYVASYNAYVNHMYRAMSNKLTERDELDTTLAACPWRNTAFRHIVSSFDQAMIDGEVPLNIASGRFPVKGIGANVFTPVPLTNFKETGGTGDQSITGEYFGGDSPNGQFIHIQEDADNPGFPGIFAELQAEGITLSLSNIELAKKTAAFAALRKNYKGVDDEWLIDLLMAGIRIPDAELAQPILLKKGSTLVGFDQRYATDGANLDKAVTRGETALTLRVRTPEMNVGGVIMVLVEIVPEQLFERRQDPYLALTDPEQLPRFDRDYLDPQKVDVVKNKEIDVHHTDPDGIFGYAPLNAKWRRTLVNIGGRYLRQDDQPFDEDRQEIWAVEQTDPELTTDFYLAENIHHKVFKASNVDPFKITTVGGADIVGLTQYGKGLTEDNGDYDAVLADVDTSEIDQGAA